MVRLLHFLGSLFTSSLRTRLSLQLEVAALRHQLSLYQLGRCRPRIVATDRLLWSIVAKLWSDWRRALFFVQPRTVTLWQKKRFRDYWQRLSQNDTGGDPRSLPSYAISLDGCGKQIPPGARRGLSRNFIRLGSRSRNRPSRRTNPEARDYPLPRGGRFSICTSKSLSRSISLSCRRRHSKCSSFSSCWRTTKTT
jgi:hypothetical protein